jgi:hypothetical protein
MKSSRRHAFIPTPNPDRLSGGDRLFAQDVVHAAILRAAGFTGLLRVPEGWRRSLAITQPVKPISASNAAAQSRQFQA